jgi:hypothetical protein
MTDPPSKYAFRSTMFGGPLIVMQGASNPLRFESCGLCFSPAAVDFGSWSPGDMALGQAMAAEWKQLRDAFWSKAGTRVQHLIAPSYPPSYFPDYMQQLHDDVHGGAGWDAIQAVSLQQLDSVVFVFRANLGAQNTTVFPRGLLMQTVYTVSSKDFGWIKEASGGQLMTKGITVEM